MSSVPDRITVIEGWRAWRVSVPPAREDPHTRDARPSPPQLQSLNTSVKDTLWPARSPAVATCLRTLQNSAAVHPVPVAICSCGFYAFKRREDLTRTFPGSEFVHGRVALWGEVIEHERGYRAQYAYPLELWVRPQNAIAGWALQETYGIPVHVDPTPTDAIDDWFTSHSPLLGRPAGPPGVPGPSGPSSPPGPPWVAPPPPMPASSVDLIMRLAAVHTEAQRRQREEAIRQIQRSDLVFPAPGGGYLNHRGWTRWNWHPTVRALKLGRYRVHDLRHFFASLLIAFGEPMPYVSQQLRHDSVTTTMKIYVHLMRESRRLDKTATLAALTDAYRHPVVLPAPGPYAGIGEELEPLQKELT